MRTTIFTSLCLAAATGCSSHDRNAQASGPTGDPTPHLSLQSCELPRGDMPPVARIGGSFGKVQTCWMYTDGTVHIEADATPGATLIVGGARQQVPADGKAILTADLDAALLRAPVAAAIEDGAGISAPPIAVRLEPPGGAKAIEGTIEVTLGDAAVQRARALLAAVSAGAALPRGELGATPPAIDHGSLVLVPVDAYAPMKAIGKATTLGQLDLVAVVKEGAKHPAEDCGPYDNFGMLPHVNVDTKVIVYEASTGKKVAEQAFDQGFEGCSMFVSGYAGEKPTVTSRPTATIVEGFLSELTSARGAS
jgi:hypothetical protein